jgi:hypothetical protein
MKLEEFKTTELPKFSEIEKRRLLEIIPDVEQYNYQTVIYWSDETGMARWAVAFEEHPEFWLDSFGTYEEAKAFCEKYELNVVDCDSPG